MVGARSAYVGEIDIAFIRIPRNIFLSNLVGNQVDWIFCSEGNIIGLFPLFPQNFDNEIKPSRENQLKIPTIIEYTYYVVKKQNYELDFFPF